MLQITHMHGSPDGPWLFLVAQSAPKDQSSEAFRLIGITDTSMLRPQVFALQQASEDGPTIGFAALEKQGIDAALESLAAEDTRFWSRADKYWNARGGSHTDGGAFVFSVERDGKLICTDKFGHKVKVDISQKPYFPSQVDESASARVNLPDLPATELFIWIKKELPAWNYEGVLALLEALTQSAATNPARAIETLTLLRDRRYPAGELRRSSLLSLYDQALQDIFEGMRIDAPDGYISVTADMPSPPALLPGEEGCTVIIEARGFPIEGPNSLGSKTVKLYKQGYRKFIVANARGHRFIGNGFGPNIQDVRIDVYGSSGDYLASGLDGVEIQVHGSAQDQLCQIIKSGKLVVHGDVGQTFGYAAKGGEVYILGNAAGRPMINAVGKPRVVINGTYLDYLAESFMAGDPRNGGGFVILNGINITDNGAIIELETPYPGGNLFSLALGGAIYVRDPHKILTEDQLNDGEFAPVEEVDWQAVKPYLEENERVFGISVDWLLGGQQPGDVYRKIQPKAVRALQAEEAWVHKPHR